MSRGFRADAAAGPSIISPWQQVVEKRPLPRQLRRKPGLFLLEYPGLFYCVWLHESPRALKNLLRYVFAWQAHVGKPQNRELEHHMRRSIKQMNNAFITKGTQFKSEKLPLHSSSYYQTISLPARLRWSPIARCSRLSQAIGGGGLLISLLIRGTASMNKLHY